MILEVYVENSMLKVEVPQEILDQGGEFFAMMDRDMDRGWKMGPEYVENPDATQRAQIAADKMLTAIDTENNRMLAMMAGYIVTKLPGVKAVKIATDGDPRESEFLID